MTEVHPDLREMREQRDAEEKAKKNKLLREQKEKEKADEKRKKEEAELRYIHSCSIIDSIFLKCPLNFLIVPLI